MNWHVKLINVINKFKEKKYVPVIKWSSKHLISTVKSISKQGIEIKFLNLKKDYVKITIENVKCWVISFVAEKKQGWFQ